VANGGIYAGTQAITCGSLTCSSESDTGALTVGGVLTANNGIVTNGKDIRIGNAFYYGFCLNLYNSAQTANSQLYATGNNIVFDNDQLNGEFFFRYNPQTGGSGIVNMLEMNTSAITTTPILNANGGIVVPSSKTISSTSDLVFTATNGENIMALGGTSSNEILNLRKNTVGSFGNSYITITTDSSSDQGILMGIDNTAAQFNGQAYIDTSRAGVAGQTPLHLKVVGNDIMLLTTTGITAYQPITCNGTTANAGLNIQTGSTNVKNYLFVMAMLILMVAI
jgi:hypothetical protein